MTRLVTRRRARREGQAARRAYRITKRAFDLAASCVALMLLAPLLALLCALVWRLDGRPVFYRATRVGLHDRDFRMLKFRTMVQDADTLGPSSTAADDARVTPLGAVLRRYKLDELPQLLNVFRGNMSIVGPRPQVRWAVSTYSGEELELLTVKPGITDYATLAFPDEGEILRGSADPDAAYMEHIHPIKMRLSLRYVREASLSTDFRIILQTVGTLARSRTRDCR